MRKILICLVLLFQLFSCSESIKDNLEAPGFSNKTGKIIIYDKTEKKSNPGKLEITDKNKIKKICYETSRLEEIRNISVKANFGYYQMEFVATNNETYNADVIYTVYNGVIIEINNKTYKNDALESLILYYFQ